MSLWPLLAAGVLLAASAALAAPGRPAPGTVFGDWQVECEAVPEGQPVCFLSQTQLLKDSNTRLLKTSLGYIGSSGEPMVVTVLPLGIDLRGGVTLRVDGGRVIPVTPQRCLQDGCIASAPLDADGVSALMKAKTLTLTLRPHGARETLAIPISSKGITAGLRALRAPGP